MGDSDRTVCIPRFTETVGAGVAFRRVVFCRPIMTGLQLLAAFSRPRCRAEIVELICATVLSLFAFAGTVRGSDGPGIPPGHEDAILSMVRGALSEADPRPTAIGVGPDVIRISFGDDTVVVVGAPHSRPGGETAHILAPGVWLECGECSPPDWQSIGERLADARAPLVPRLWHIYGRDPAEAGDAMAQRPWTSAGPGFTAWRVITWSVLAFATGWLLFAAATALRGPLRVSDVLVVLVVLVFIGVAAAVPEWVPTHEHNSFVARTDCARALACDEDPRGPAWARPVFHVYNLLLRTVEPRLGGAGLVSLALIVAGLLLCNWFVRLLFAHFDLADAGRVAGLWTIVLSASQPVVLRLAVADTFWPLTILALWASGIALLTALRTGSPLAALAAASWFALCIQSNFVYTAILPVAPLAALCWSRPFAVPRAGALAAWVTFVILIAPGMLEVWQIRADGAVSIDSALDVRLALANLGEKNIWLEFRHTPLFLSLSVAVGALAMLAGLFRPLLPVVLVYIGTEVMLRRVVPPIDTAWPGLLLQAFPGLLVLPVVGGAGLGWLQFRSPARVRAAIQIVAAAFLAISMAGAVDGWRFATDTTVVQRELIELSNSFELLPPHDLLLVPPLLHRGFDGVAMQSDPVEAVFPAGKYHYVMSRRGIQPGRVIDLESWLGAIAGDFPPPVGISALVYVGATHRMFLPAEIAAGVVPPSLERQALATLRTVADLEPVHTFRIATQQHPGVTMRLAADRVDEVELGFYWVRLKEKRAQRGDNGD